MMQCHGGIPYAQEHGFALQSVDALYNTLLLTAMLTRCPRLQQFPEGPCVHRPQGYKFRLTQFADLRLQYPAFIYVCVVHGLVGNGEGLGGARGRGGGKTCIFARQQPIWSCYLLTVTCQGKIQVLADSLAAPNLTYLSSDLTFLNVVNTREP